MLLSDTLDSIMSHLGGEGILTQIGAHAFVSDDTHVSFRLDHANPKKIHSVVISFQPNGFFNMDCYGHLIPGTFSAPLLGTAKQILPENLATVLGQLTGIDLIHHSHF
jgi:hypothetical protein